MPIGLVCNIRKRMKEQPIGHPLEKLDLSVDNDKPARAECMGRNIGQLDALASAGSAAPSVPSG